MTVDCQCAGDIFIDGHQFALEPYNLDLGNGVIERRPAGFSCNGAPTHVPPEVLAAIIEHARELEPLLKAAGWWSCGCEEREDVLDEDFDFSIPGTAPMVS